MNSDPLEARLAEIDAAYRDDLRSRPIELIAAVAALSLCWAVILIWAAG